VKITIESTPKIVTLRNALGELTARVWQGHTESGIPVQVFVTRIAPEIPKTDPRIDEITAEFERDLKRQADPRITVDAIPLRFLI
jgi:hypothetical protein